MTPRTAGLVALVGGLGWIGLVWLGIRLYATNPPTAGFDLELLLQAGRNVAAGRSPYDPAMLAGTAPVAEALFYSYPPVVAQAMAVFASIPSPVMFVAWTVAAVAGLGFVARTLAARIGAGLVASSGAGLSASPLVVGVTAVALVPLMFPFAIGLLFGNLDVFFPLLYGMILIGVLPAASTAAASRSGAAASVASVAKLHPGSLGLWLLVRSFRASEVRRALVSAAAVLVAVLAISLLVGGVQPWSDYVTVIGAGSRADLVDPRNAGPAAQIALVLGGGSGPALARALQIPVAAIALVMTVVAAIRLADPVESLAWAAAASLVVLPVTWYHYPSALIPFAIAALLRSRAPAPAIAQRVSLTVGAAAVVAAIAIAWLPLLYVAIGLVLAAVRMSRGRSTQ
jgi:Glycosyltransferase family 87